MTSIENSTETAVAEYIWVATDDVWGDVPSRDEHVAACERAEAWLTDHEGDDISIRVRPPRRGEAGGLYRVTSTGDLQILGYSVREPEHIRELTDAARAHVVATWPRG